MSGSAVTGPDPPGQARTYLMCPPAYFAVDYAINPWMTGGVPVDRRRAMRQWRQLRAALTRLGHTVRTIQPEPGLPDMVFSANAATVICGRVLAARFRHPQRSGEVAAYLRWFRRAGYATVRRPRAVHEGEGDVIFAGQGILAGHGFRTDAAIAAELTELFGLPVIGLTLTDPRFYHLDTALAVLDPDTAAYYPAAFDHDSVAALAARFGRLIEAKDTDAEVLGLNAISDGTHVILPAQARELADQIAAAGLEPVPVDVSEFRKAGGGPKCCALELR